MAVFAVAALLWWAGRTWLLSAGGEGREGPAAARYFVAVRVVAVVVALVVAVGCCVQVYRIGESGSKAVWHDSVSTTPG
ncbi:hypothetical protein [Streptomyces spectabilis]|uniref:DUF1206 domain-containing protein n=1 Tax=Streptomyces spectabilis TaxID=68270 RepID=A0A516R1B3_STRST|nr:hypothetical protein [Streptomyces spectabilis]QDQ09448.1 hypothetical protein FH965_01780 [Streptomyces spectabilis]